MLLRHLKRVLQEVVASGLGKLALGLPGGGHAHTLGSLKMVHIEFSKRGHVLPGSSVPGMLEPRLWVAGTGAAGTAGLQGLLGTGHSIRLPLLYWTNHSNT